MKNLMTQVFKAGTHSILFCLILVFATGSLSTGCTHNNGDIGNWFGQWRVALYVDGAKQDVAPGVPYMFWSFQGGVVRVSIPDHDKHLFDEGFGLWSEQDGYLVLDFTDETTPALQTPIPLPDYCRLKIVNSSSRKIELQCDATDGSIMYYVLEKWG